MSKIWKVEARARFRHSGTSSRVQNRIGGENLLQRNACSPISDLEDPLMGLRYYSTYGLMHPNFGSLTSPCTTFTLPTAEHAMVFCISFFGLLRRQHGGVYQPLVLAAGFQGFRSSGIAPSHREGANILTAYLMLITRSTHIHSRIVSAHSFEATYWEISHVGHNTARAHDHVGQVQHPYDHTTLKPSPMPYRRSLLALQALSTPARTSCIG